MVYLFRCLCCLGPVLGADDDRYGFHLHDYS